MERILIVEDEGITALSIQQTLIKLGYEVVGIAGTPAEALHLGEVEQPDLILMDINLGKGSDGIETAAEMQQRRSAAVVYLTAYSEAATLKRARHTAPYGYLLKPFSEHELHATIQMAIERHGVDTALADSEERLRLALDAAEMGSWDLDVASGQMRRQGLTDALFGLDPQSFDGSWASFLELVFVEDREPVHRALVEALDRANLMSVEFRSIRDGGGCRWFRVQARIYSRPGASNRLIGVAQDITALRQSEAALRRAATVFSSAKDAIFIADSALKLLAINQAFTDITGYTAADVAGRRVDDWLLRANSGASMLDLQAKLDLTGNWHGEVTGLRHTGNSYPAWLNVTSVPGAHGDEAQIVGTFSDIGALRQAEAQMRQLAYHCPLTGLPNRLLAMDRLDQAIHRAKRNHWRVAVMMIDLDNFKRINDTLGHAAGDEVLCEVANRLTHTLRSVDTVARAGGPDTVARLGGDEFIVILENVGAETDIAGVATKLLKRLDRPMMLSGCEIRPCGSIGIGLYPNDAEDAQILLRAADTAMYAAKDSGRRRTAFYSKQMTEKVSWLVSAEQELRRGFAAGELRVYYQPQVSLADMRLSGLEALVRWEHPQRGLLSAAEVIPIAEVSGLILDIGAFVLETVCRQIRAWLDLGLRSPRIAVNVSVNELASESFVQHVVNTLAAARLKSGQLEIELTESTLQQESICVPALEALDKIGVALSLDDFGTGYSSLSSLSRLPIGRCKIDRSFVRNIASRVRDEAMGGAIIDLGHRLKMQITAEGVENEAQLEVLRALGCDEVQGYLFGKAMPAADIEQLLRAAKADALAPMVRAG